MLQDLKDLQRTLLATGALFALGALSWAAFGANDDVMVVSMQKLNSIEWAPGDEIPEDVSVYDGMRIEISGYMRNGTTEGQSWFDLTNDSCGCGTSKLQHFVRVKLKQGTTTFTPAELTLTGSFAVSEHEDEDGFVDSLYRLEIVSLSP